MSKPNLSGTWKFNHTKSVLQIQPPDSSVFVVTHHEPALCLSRTHVYGEKSDTFTLDLTTDGRDVAFAQSGMNALCRAFWEGDVLVFDTQLTNGTERATNTVRYVLSGARDTIVAEERFRSKSLNYDNVWVLDRQ